MEAPENVSWLAMVLAMAIIAGLSVAYYISMMMGSLEEDLYIRVIRSEYVSNSPFSLAKGPMYSVLPTFLQGSSKEEGVGGGYLIDLRIGNMMGEPLGELEFVPIGFGRGEVFLSTGESITSGYHLDKPIPPKGSLELSIYIPSDYVPGEKVLLVKGILENGRVASKSVSIP